MNLFYQRCRKRIGKTPNFSGTGDNGDKIRVVITGPNNTEFTQEVTVSNGKWTIDFDELTDGDGIYSWVVTATDVAGNTTDKIGNFILDTEPPTVTGELVNDSGLDDDNITNEKS